MIIFQKINLSYNNAPVFRDLSLTVQRGDKILLAGRSGTGKSSLLAMLLGFIVPNSGDIYFDTIHLDAQTIWNIRKRIAYVDQEVSIKSGIVKDWIDSVVAFQANKDVVACLGAIHELCDLFGCEHRILEKRINELSGGERQRIALIVAILLGRNVFVFDEVTSSLDKKLKQLVVDYFMGNNEWTVIAISHDHEWHGHANVKIFNIEEQKWAQ